MKKLLLLALGLICGAFIPFGTYAENSETTLLSGQDFNVAIRELAGDERTAISNTSNTTITEIVQYTGNTIPVGVTTGVLSIEGSEYPVYGRYEGGIIYYWSEAETIYMNQDSSNMFYNCSSLTSLDVSNFDTSNVTNMSSMFYNCSSLTSLDVSNWDTSNVTDMSHMFRACSSLESLDVSNWNTSNVTNMSNMFYNCSSLTSLDLSNFDTSNVTTILGMFDECGEITELDLSSWNTSNVTNMEGLFYNAYKLKTVYASDKFVTSGIAGPLSYSIFQNCESLVGGNGTQYDDSHAYDHTYARIDTAETPGYFTLKTEYTIMFNSGDKGVLNGQIEWTGIISAGLTISGAGIIIPEVIPNSGYVFSGWDPELTGTTLITHGQTYKVVYGEDKNGNGKNDDREEHFTLIFSGGENGILSGKAEWPNVLTGLTFAQAGVTIPQVIPNSGYIFGGWNPKTPSSGDIVTTNYSVIRKVDANNNGIADEDEKSSGSSSGGGYSGKGGGSSSSNNSSKSNNSTTKNDSSKSIKTGNNQTKISPDNSTYIEGSIGLLNSVFTQEQKDAYIFAKEKGITTMPTIQEAQMDGKLTRIAMAKMLSYYAINVLGQKPDETRNNKFNDITDKLDAQYDSGVTLAYQLGIMGINMPNNNFRPNDEVTRAEFATALSRMLYSTPDGKPYYITHLAKLKAEGILKNNDYKMKELRGYVMIMLKRSANSN